MELVMSPKGWKQLVGLEVARKWQWPTRKDRDEQVNGQIKEKTGI